jgi:hypothetical protein
MKRVHFCGPIVSLSRSIRLCSKCALCKPNVAAELKPGRTATSSTARGRVLRQNYRRTGPQHPSVEAIHTLSMRGTAPQELP